MDNYFMNKFKQEAAIRPPFYEDGLGAIRCSRCGRMYAFPKPILNEYGAVISHGKPFCPRCEKR